jgi:hypothetical protein
MVSFAAFLFLEYGFLKQKYKPSGAKIHSKMPEMKAHLSFSDDQNISVGTRFSKMFLPLI